MILLEKMMEQLAEKDTLNVQKIEVTSFSLSFSLSSFRILLGIFMRPEKINVGDFPADEDDDDELI